MGCVLRYSFNAYCRIRIESMEYNFCTLLQTVLDGRLDVRVDDMIKQGLIEEMQEFHEQYNRQRLKDDNGEAKWVLLRM